MSSWVISTNRARCRDCYRCVRTCTVKAVKIENGQAQVVPELCLACGDCVRACPQKAKTVRDDRPAVREALAAGRPVVASVAPSAPAYFGIRTFAQMEAALLALGFRAAGETAFGAEMVGLAHGDLLDAHPERWPLITSSCPVVINLIERYYPDLIPHLAPIVSPMIAHGRWLRARYGPEAMIIFIGPCIAKKAEILDPAVAGAVDAALTFAELQEWLDEAGVRLPPDEEPPQAAERAPARLFPVEGGLVGTARLETDMLASDIVATSGLAACQDVLRSIREGQLQARMVELMACEGGCINGPAMENCGGAYLARQRVLAYARLRQPQPLPSREEWPPLERSYQDRSVPLPTFTEAQIRQVLARVDKHTPEDELNCGACGYPTCREKAIATLRGMAEATMCIPYMRQRAESLRQVVMEVTPNPILIVDTRLYIQDLSPSAEKMFHCRRSNVVGKPLQHIMPVVEGFSRVRNEGRPILSETVQMRPDLTVEQTIVPVEGENLLVGILKDVTERERQRAELERLRSETLSRTQEVIKNQMRVAHEIAQLLGEATAETKTMLSRLAQLMEEKESGDG
jgi:PAS domain S-box-containing protein